MSYDELDEHKYILCCHGSVTTEWVLAPIFKAKVVVVETKEEEAFLNIFFYKQTRPFVVLRCYVYVCVYLFMLTFFSL